MSPVLAPIKAAAPPTTPTSSSAAPLAAPESNFDLLTGIATLHNPKQPSNFLKENFNNRSKN